MERTATVATTSHCLIRSSRWLRKKNHCNCDPTVCCDFFYTKKERASSAFRMAWCLSKMSTIALEPFVRAKVMAVWPRAAFTDKSAWWPADFRFQKNHTAMATPFNMNGSLSNQRVPEELDSLDGRFLPQHTWLFWKTRNFYSAKLGSLRCCLPIKTK